VVRSFQLMRISSFNIICCLLSWFNLICETLHKDYLHALLFASHPVTKWNYSAFSLWNSLLHIVHNFFFQAGADVFYEQHVTRISLRDGKWEVFRKMGPPEQFDVVILTMPVPQILQLQGDIVNSKFIPHNCTYLA